MAAEGEKAIIVKSVISKLKNLDQKIRVIPFEETHQEDVDIIMENIALEFKAPIFSAGSKKIADIYHLPGHQFWVAFNQDKVIGTIGVIQLAEGNLVLKSMFVSSMYRGQGVSHLLLNNVINWAAENNCIHIFLGTMTQFTAAQRFYEKNEFVKCDPADLPADFAGNALDTIFYQKRLKF